MNKKAVIAFIMAVLALGMLGFSASPTYSHVEFALPKKVCGPSSIARGPDGAMWFDERRTCQAIGRVTPDGHIKEFLLVSHGLGAGQIIRGPDDAMWFASGSKIGRIAGNGNVSSVSLPGSLAALRLTLGRGKRIWFLGQSYAVDPPKSCVGAIDGQYHVRSWCDERIGFPGGITAGPDNDIWMVGGGDAITRLDGEGHFSFYHLPKSSRFATPQSIALGPDGNLWFTERQGRRIGRITPSGEITEFSSLPQGVNYPSAIVAGPDKAMWFTTVSQIGKIDMNGAMTFYYPKRPDSLPTGIAIGSDGAIWFTEYNFDAIGKIELR